jgi:hypothetical protein
MTDKNIKNEQWYVKTLASKVLNKEIFKPKYQRKRKWDLFPKKENIPSEKKYIEFLFETYNSVHAITFGQDGKNLSNIDGNNRINAILHFLEEPFVLFSEKITGLITFIKDTINDEIASQVETIIKKMTYNDLMLFKYNKYFIDNNHNDLYNQHLKQFRDELEPFFDELIINMKINKKDRFDNDVKINVNLFECYSTEELAEVFGKINQYNCGLTEQEALASRLFNITNFTIHNKVLEYELKQYLKQYYSERTNDEVLTCYIYDENNDIMNAYDFMVGFQNYCNEKCSLIHKTDNDGLSLFFKIFKNIYKGSFDVTFTTENVNSFIEFMLQALKILQKLQTCIFMENLVGGSKIFDAANKKLNSLKKNNLYLIITSIIGYIKINTKENEILKSIEKCLLFHFFVNALDNKDKRDQYKLLDTILYESGGAFIDAKAKEYLKMPNLISSKISKEIMLELINDLVNENIKNKKYEVRKNGKDKLDKRRQRKLHEKVLIYYYYNNKVPNEFLKNNFWVEHVFPFSCSWDDDLDIDRLGNIFPILETLNRERSNKHISEYKKIDKFNFLRYIDIIPSNEIYNQVVKHDTKKPHINNSEKYNECCEKNEKVLIHCFIENLFDNK